METADLKDFKERRLRLKAMLKAGYPSTIALREFGIEAICGMIAGGATMRDIAAELGVEVASLSTFLARPENRQMVRAARQAAADVLADSMLSKIESARDPFDLAKVKEYAHHVRWLARAYAPEKYGEHVNVNTETDMRSIPDAVLLARIQKLLGNENRGNEQ
ncbi:MAG: hypothetical protein N2045_14075 [Fimbriimonadales bacterium]|nr:hypothetical protein [Fimbriimonadales bacterium]